MCVIYHVCIHQIDVCPSVQGVVIKYSEPAEARQPTTRWRLYQFKGEEVLREYILPVEPCMVAVLTLYLFCSHSLHSQTECLPHRPRQTRKRCTVITVCCGDL